MKLLVLILVQLILPNFALASSTTLLAPPLYQAECKSIPTTVTLAQHGLITERVFYRHWRIELHALDLNTASLGASFTSVLDEANNLRELNLGSGGETPVNQLQKGIVIHEPQVSTAERGK